MEDARELIIYYLGVYDGSSKRAIERTADDIKWSYKKIADARNAAQDALYWLLDNKYVVYVPYNEMNEFERRYFDSDCCDIYRVLKRFDESEYLKEKYGNKE